VDPKIIKFPYLSSFLFAGNNPIRFIDIFGAEIGDPLKNMKIRENRASNLFGKVRAKNGVQNSKSHQGFDYYASEGTNILAVKDAEVFAIQESDEGDYGKSLTLKITDENGNITYAFYAHLSSIDVSLVDKEGNPTKVKEGDAIGKTGTTGNAKGFIGENQHLHFEYRSQANCGIGLTGRLNPNDVTDTDFTSQDDTANQTDTGVIKFKTNGTIFYQNITGSETIEKGPTIPTLDNFLPGQPKLFTLF
jgi:murein DD-endopeptidase MepM/ murein hydrolase activator NlpD